MKKKLLIGSFLILGLAAFVAVLTSVDWDVILASLREITPSRLLLFLMVTQIYFLTFNWRWQIIVRSHGYHPSFWQLYLYRLTGYTISTLTPTQLGGEPARIYYLYENHGIPLREATASVYLDKLIEMMAFVAFVSSGIFVVSFTNLIPESILIPVALLMAGFLLLGAYAFKKILDGSGFLTSLFQQFGLSRFKRIRRWEYRLLKVEKLIGDFLSHTDHKTSTVPLLFFLSFAGWSATILECYLLCSFFGIELSFLQSFLIGTIPMIAYLLPVPAGLGMYESAVIGLFNLLGLNTGVGFALVVMIRAKEVLYSCAGALYGVTHGLSLLRKSVLPDQIVVMGEMEQGRPEKGLVSRSQPSFSPQGQTESGHSRKQDEQGQELPRALK